MNKDGMELIATPYCIRLHPTAPPPPHSMWSHPHYTIPTLKPPAHLPLCLCGYQSRAQPQPCQRSKSLGPSLTPAPTPSSELVSFEGGKGCSHHSTKPAFSYLYKPGQVGNIRNAGSPRPQVGLALKHHQIWPLTQAGGKFLRRGSQSPGSCPSNA